jgi:biotin operon repressor
MTVLTLNEAAARALGGLRLPRRAVRSGAPHRTGQPVRRDSMEAGTFEEMFFAAPAPGETDRLLRIARQALDAGRRLRRDERAGAKTLSASERLVTSLTAGAVRVYEELLTLARLNRGRVFPSYDHLAEATGLGRATVARALAILERIGFLVRQRRFHRVEGEAGPRYAQTSNAYRPVLPQGVLAYLPRWMRPAPLPDDQVHREAECRAETEAMLAGLSCQDFAQATVGGPLGKMLAKLGAAVDRRLCESHNNPEPLPNLYRQQQKDVGLAGQQHSA